MKAEQSGDVSGDPPTKNNAVDVAVPMSSTQYQQQDSPSVSRVANKNMIKLSIGTILILIAIIITAVVLTQEKSSVVEKPPPPNVDFSTGVSLVTSYAIETKVRSRLARTKITMEVANALDCSSIHVISLQLPLDTRITSVKTIVDNGCTSRGDVQELKEARENFMEAASNGLPVAYVEVAQDSSTHSIQVAIPPLGTSNVELVLEQLLKQRLDEVNFDIPLAPNEKVDSVVFDLMVEDTSGQPVDFYVDLDVPGVYGPSVGDGGNSTVKRNSAEPIHLDIPDARQHNLPRVIRGKYNPGKLPENGLLYTDGRCFEHFFHPESLAPMPRNFVFLIDKSSSMQYDSKMYSAKQALTLFIDSLTPEDTFTIQSFGNKGTEQLWGSGPGTTEEKKDAKKFVNSMSLSSWDTNLHEAFLEGLLRAKHDASVSDASVATILVVLSDGYATRGETNRTKIAEHIYELNEEGTVKIFSLGFEGSADMQLLDAIALMNGGVSAPLLQGQDGFAEQITNFLDSELGSVLMSDVNVQYSGASEETKVYGETQNVFPLLADGYEVVVRGLVGEAGNNKTLRTITSASTLKGIKNWELSVTPDDIGTVKSSLCFQSYAHDRITQLLRLYDASEFLGNELIKRLVNLSSQKDCDEKEFAKCIRAEALALATEANVVAKGLTAMVTVDDDGCMKVDDDAGVCIDGTTTDGRKPARDDDYAYDASETSGAMMDSSYKMDDGYSYSSGAGAPPPRHGLVYFFALLSAWFFVAILKI